jgi:hypothetical protein
MKHYGIWVLDNKTKKVGWLINGQGEIFWTTGMGVAKAMLKKINRDHSTTRCTFEIREFEE